MNTILHAQKMGILTRLIKADQITLEEAITLLREEEVLDLGYPAQPVLPSYPGWGPWSPVTVSTNTAQNVNGCFTVTN